jgi:hypothetical protein
MQFDLNKAIPYPINHVINRFIYIAECRDALYLGVFNCLGVTTRGAGSGFSIFILGTARKTIHSISRYTHLGLVDFR